MGLLGKTKNKAGPRELGEDELPNVINADQPNTPKQRRFWPGKNQQKGTEEVSGSDPAAETDLPTTPAQKKRSLFGRKKVAVILSFASLALPALPVHLYVV